MKGAGNLAWAVCRQDGQVADLRASSLPFEAGRHGIAVVDGAYRIETVEAHTGAKGREFVQGRLIGRHGGRHREQGNQRQSCRQQCLGRDSGPSSHGSSITTTP